MAKSTTSTKKANSVDIEKDEVAEVVETPATPELPADQNEVVDVTINMSQRRPFRLNRDPNKIIYLDVADMGVGMRLRTAYDNLIKMMEKIADLGSKEDMTEDEQKTVLKTMEDLNERMKEQVDYIFNSPVADMCCDGGTMWDPYMGMFRFEHIIDALCGLYENNLSYEFMKMRSRVNGKVTQYRKTASKYHK